jgi:UDP-N-acetylglucosamine:LPS N-acetylglucosamine transferase
MTNKQKICIITSKGGHLYQIYQLNSLFKKYVHFWITFHGKDTDFYLTKDQVYYAHYPESRNAINFIKNLFLAFKIFLKEKPNIIISCGAGIAVPFFLVGKYIFHIKTIYIESYDFIKYPSLTGKILYPVTDLFLIQHQCQNNWYPNAIHWGSLL